MADPAGGWDGSGHVVRGDGTRIGSDTWDGARQVDVLVNSPDHDRHDEGLAKAIENCIARDGQNFPSADLPMDGHKHSGCGAATQRDQYATWGQVRDATLPFVPAPDVGNTLDGSGDPDPDAITLAPTPAIARYETGRGFRFIVKHANTGPVTVAVSGQSPVSLRNWDGDELVDSDLEPGRHVTIIHNGQYFLSDVHEHAESGASGDGSAPWARAVDPEGTAESERLGTGAGANKVLFSGAAGGDAAEWRDPFSVSKPGLFAFGGDGSVRLRWKNPASNSAIQERQYRYREHPDPGTGYGGWITTPADDVLVEGLDNAKVYRFQVRSRNADGWSAVSDGMNGRPRPAEHRVTAAGASVFVWPYDETKARVVVYGGGGGAAGYTGGVPPNQTNGSDGASSSASFGGTTISAGGGAGAPAANPNQLLPRDEASPDPDYGAGSGNGGVSYLVQGLYEGFPGLPGDLVFGELTGLAKGSQININVGAGGARGAGTHPIAGGDGGPGSVTLIPHE